MPNRRSVVANGPSRIIRRRIGDPRRAAQRGRTLLEMVIVVAIISMAAALAVPSTSSTQVHELNLAASAVADGFRFAREEAQRTGQVHGVSVDVSNDLLRVFRLDEGPNPNVVVYDVRHPITKQLYAVQIGSAPFVGVELDSYGGSTTGACNDSTNVAIDAHGMLRCFEPTTTRIENASVSLSVGQLVLSVAIDSYTGRVSVQ